MPAFLFVSYRRTDSQHAALGLCFQLRLLIGPESVFIDRSGILAGDNWPERLREKISHATVVIALIGPGWLCSADQYGRRRLDMPNDWVRNELLAAIGSRKPVIPILLAPFDMPPREALPDALRPLCDYETYSIHDDSWDSDLHHLAQLLVEKHGFTNADQKAPTEPREKISVKPLTQAELDNELQSLSGWELVQSLIPGDYPKSRHELRKAYDFDSFQAAVQFMNSAASPIDEAQHHPRWENQWRTVTVYLSTWDIGWRISRLDIDLAKALDGVYKERTRPPDKPLVIS